jgi:hypothetical protein
VAEHSRTLEARYASSLLAQSQPRYLRGFYRDYLMSLRWAVGVMDDKELFGDGLLAVLKLSVASWF